jgi:hypothetical protein
MDEMTRHNSTTEETAAIDQALRKDVLISQIIDAEGDGSAWAQFAQIATTDPTAWRELALAQRDHAALSHAVAQELQVADETELPAPASAGGHAGSFSYRLSRWGGWAAAAALAVTWLGVQFAAIRDSHNRELAAGNGAAVNPNMASILPVGAYQLDSPQDAISAYKQLGQQSGTVLGELPDRVIVESRPLAGGRGYEVVYLRQFMERAQVAELYQVSRDDSGQQRMLLPVAQPTVKRSNRID